jgi:hypothetical protein
VGKIFIIISGSVTFVIRSEFFKSLTATTTMIKNRKMNVTPVCSFNGLQNFQDANLSDQQRVQNFKNMQSANEHEKILLQSKFLGQFVRT